MIAVSGAKGKGTGKMPNGLEILRKKRANVDSKGENNTNAE